MKRRVLKKRQNQWLQHLAARSAPRREEVPCLVHLISQRPVEVYLGLGGWGDGFYCLRAESRITLTGRRGGFRGESLSFLMGHRTELPHPGDPIVMGGYVKEADLDAFEVIPNEGEKDG